MTDEKPKMPKVGALWIGDDGQLSGEFTCQHCAHRQKVAIYPNGYKKRPTHPDYLLKGKGEPTLDEYAAKRAEEAKAEGVPVPDPIPF
jgi:hypothetical protein